MPDDPDLRFTIDGPDDDGFVWIKSPEGDPNIWGVNLGKKDDVAEALCQWLGSIDYQEDGPDILDNPDETAGHTYAGLTGWPDEQETQNPS